MPTRVHADPVSTIAVFAGSVFTMVTIPTPVAITEIVRLTGHTRPISLEQSTPRHFENIFTQRWPTDDSFACSSSGGVVCDCVADRICDMEDSFVDVRSLMLISSNIYCNCFFCLDCVSCLFK